MYCNRPLKKKNIISKNKLKKNRNFSKPTVHPRVQIEESSEFCG